MTTTRRNLLSFGVGAGVATVFTPLPWKLLDDVSIWTQNWPWIPTPPRGELKARNTVCTLCNSGCGLTARCVGPNAVGISPASTHPVSRGVTCPAALDVHQLPYHTSRLLTPIYRKSPITLDRAIGRVAHKLDQLKSTGQHIAFLSLRHGYAANSVSASFIGQHKNAHFSTPVQAEAATVRAYAALAKVPASELAIDFDALDNVISFGAPLLESWATPGGVLPRWADGKLQIIQIEASLSKTAALATNWIAIQPGEEAKLAHNISRELNGESTNDEQAHQIAAQATGASVFVSGGQLPPEAEAQIAALNALIHTKAFVRRPALEVASEDWDRIPNGSVGLLLIDCGLAASEFSWTAIAPKLAASAMTVALTPYKTSAASNAEVLVPTPAIFESLEDTATAWDNAVETYAIAPAINKPPAGVTTVAEFLNHLTSGTGSVKDTAKAHLASLHAKKAGTVTILATGESKSISEFESADKLWEAFGEGAVWQGKRGTSVAAAYKPIELNHTPTSAELTLSVLAQRPNVPLETKVNQESHLCRREGRVYLHPTTARNASLKTGDRAQVRTSTGTATFEVEIDPSVNPRALEIVQTTALSLQPESLPAEIRRA